MSILLDRIGSGSDRDPGVQDLDRIRSRSSSRQLDRIGSRSKKIGSDSITELEWVSFKNAWLELLLQMLCGAEWVERYDGRVGNWPKHIRTSLPLHYLGICSKNSSQAFLKETHSSMFYSIECRVWYELKHISRYISLQKSMKGHIVLLHWEYWD